MFVLGQLDKENYLLTPWLNSHGYSFLLKENVAANKKIKAAQINLSLSRIESLKLTLPGIGSLLLCQCYEVKTSL